MKFDVTDLEDGQRIRKKICIIGAGAAGIALAREFMKDPSLEIVLLEGGGFDFEPGSQMLYLGEHENNTLSPSARDGYMVASRKRQFGGSTNCWAGWCVPLDHEDFEKREWIAHSGWPINLSDLEPYYQRARLEHLHTLPHTEDFQKELEKSFRPYILHNDRVLTRVLLRRKEVPRFGTLYRDDIVKAPNVSLILHANVIDIRTHDDKETVSEVVVQNLDKKTIHVEADEYILATGGIENARILLAANKDQPQGLGNTHDLVGRFFMEHLELQHVAKAFIVHHKESFPLYFRLPNITNEHVLYAAFCLSEKLQYEKRLLNCSMYLDFNDSQISRKNHPFKLALGRVITHLEKLPKKCGIESEPTYLGGITVRAEQSPHPDNRITLTHEKDALGIAKAKLKWNATPQDYQSIYESVKYLGLELGRSAGGRIQLAMNPEKPSNNCFGGPHHIGTTRMHESSREGVVDSNCKVHDLNNLYIAGSSVFPTGGYANPTFSIVALAIRLADHLKSKGAS